MEKKKLYKSRNNKKLCGVCGGIAEYLEMDPSMVRLVTALAIIPGGVSIWIYIIAAFVMEFPPENTYTY